VQGEGKLNNQGSVLRLKAEAISTDVTYGVRLKVSKPLLIVEVK
jgi:hypothetical protein